MFDVSLTELMVIAVVALVVIGPERLPKVARTAGHILGRLQRYVNTVKADINREMQIEELKSLQQSVTEQVKNMESAVTHEMRDIESSASLAKVFEHTPPSGPDPASDLAASADAATAVPPSPTSAPLAEASINVAPTTESTQRG